MKYPVSIIIPVYQNYEIFYNFFEINRKYFEGCEVIVMNDYPEKNINKPVKKIYNEAIVVNNKKNLGFEKISHARSNKNSSKGRCSRNGCDQGRKIRLAMPDRSCPTIC